MVATFAVAAAYISGILSKVILVANGDTRDSVYCETSN